MIYKWIIFSPLSLENLQHVKFSSCISSKMICYSLHTAVCLDQGRRSLLPLLLSYSATSGKHLASLQPICPSISPPSRKTLGKHCLPQGAPPDPAQVQLEDTSTVGTPPHFSPTSGSPGSAATWLMLLLPATFHPKPQPGSCLQPAPYLPPAPGVTNPFNWSLTGAVLPLSLNGAAITLTSGQSPNKVTGSGAGS